MASVTEDKDSSRSYIKVISISNVNNIFRCKLAYFKNTKSGPKLSSGIFKKDDNLYLKSNENGTYRDGFIITEVNATPGGEFIQFANSIRLFLGQEQGGTKEEIIKRQIKETIKIHFEKELQLRGRGIKVLTLLFLDKVRNYRIYKEQQVQLGPYAKYFEKYYNEVSKEYENKVEIIPASEVHDGYFSKDNEKIKDTRGNTASDADTYSLIMKDKEKLLDIKNPLKFIFSHSALREGWDNPNVFQICTLNETISPMKKRQEIGRGLRLPVNQDGERVEEDHINNLVVIANENYHDFVDKLQKEFEDDCGVTFGKLPMSAFVGMHYMKDNKEKILSDIGSKKIWTHLKEEEILSGDGVILDKFDESLENHAFSVPEEFQKIQNEIIEKIESFKKDQYIRRHKKKKCNINREVFVDPEFKKFWNSIAEKTIYCVKYETGDIINKASKAIRDMEKVIPIKITTHTASVKIESRGLKAQLLRTPTEEYITRNEGLPDILAYIQGRIQLTRGTIFKILKESNRLNDFPVNPQVFMDNAIKKIKDALQEIIIEGIQYKKLGKCYEMSRFNEDEHRMEFIDDRIIPTSKSIYEYIYWESRVEKRFAEGLNGMENIKYFIKLPNWFKVPTPVGEYNPDWAILKQNGDVVYMIKETKSTKDTLKLRLPESHKIKCGQIHFESIGVNYEVCTSIEDCNI